MQIIKTNLTFTNLIKRTNTNRIIIHHSASQDVAAAEIHKWHKNRGFSGIGYHFVIRNNGLIEEGRPMGTIGAHAGNGGNSDSLGICLTGNFENSPPSPEQIKALVDLIKYLRNYYQKDLIVIGHKDVNATACPGKYFPWAEVQQKLAIPQWQEKIITDALANGLITEYHNPQDPAPKWFVLAVALNILKKLGGQENENT